MCVCVNVLVCLCVCVSVCLSALCFLPSLPHLSYPPLSTCLLLCVCVCVRGCVLHSFHKLLLLFSPIFSFSSLSEVLGFCVYIAPFIFTLFRPCHYKTLQVINFSVLPPLPMCASPNLSYLPSSKIDVPNFFTGVFRNKSIAPRGDPKFVFPFPLGYHPPFPLAFPSHLPLARALSSCLSFLSPSLSTAPACTA